MPLNTSESKKLNPALITKPL